MNLKDAANYIKRRNAPLPALVVSIKRVLKFPQERANRLARYIIITRAYAKGEDVARIADRFGCSRHTVQRYARLAGLPTRPKHFPHAVRAAVLRDYRRKLPVAAIARLHDVSEAYVSKIAREAGISRYAKRPKRRRLATR